MEVSLGSFLVLVLILFPGIIIRKLYFYGEFSKQFSGGFSLIKLIAVSAVPGFINLICIFFFYDRFISHIDLEEIINTCKELNDPSLKLGNVGGISIKDSINKNVFPFFGFLTFSSILIGSLSGRFVRISRLDTKFKILRFKNFWFYAFSGEVRRFKKLKHLNEDKQKHLFTRADILIESSSKTHLYSGIVVDYELSNTDGYSLSKVILQEAKRYKLDEQNKRVPRNIPGNILIVDCSRMKNINLTYVSEKMKGFFESRTPSIIDNIFSIAIILVFPICFFKTDLINWNWYLKYFEFSWYEKLIFYLTLIQTITIFNPFVKTEAGEYSYGGWSRVIAKLIWIILFGILLWILN
jgi:hypothetical protein